MNCMLVWRGMPDVCCRKGAWGKQCAGIGEERSRERLEGGDGCTLEWEP